MNLYSHTQRMQFIVFSYSAYKWVLDGLRIWTKFLVSLCTNFGVLGLCCFHLQTFVFLGSAPRGIVQGSSGGALYVP